MTQTQIRMHSKSENLHQAAILNCYESHISCQNYFCRIAKFGEDILITTNELLQVKGVQYGSFDLEL